MYPTIGPIPIREVTRAHCDAVMRKLPERAQSFSPASQPWLAEVLNLAELLPATSTAARCPGDGFLKPLPRKLWAVLYPQDTSAARRAEQREARRAALLSGAVRLPFTARGCARAEATALRWRDVDLENGVVELDKNKTDHARG